MDLRNTDNIFIDEAIIHVVDTRQNEVILSRKNLDLSDEEVYKFVKNHLYKALKDDNCFKAKLIYTSQTIQYVEDLINSDSIIEGSVYFADKFFKIQKSEENKASDFLLAKIRVGDIRAIAIAILDFKISYIHEIDIEEGELSVKLNSQETSLPNINQRVSKAAFFWKDPRNGLQTVCLDKNFDKEEPNQNVFVSKLLNAKKEMDYKAKTRQTRKIVENWIRKNLKDEFELASNIRGAFESTFREGVIVNPAEIISSVPEINSREDSDLKTSLERGGVDVDETFEVDKRYVEDKMKKKNIVTDTGFTIRADFELFDGDSFIEIKQNADGTADYIIKNVRYTKER